MNECKLQENAQLVKAMPNRKILLTDGDGQHVLVVGTQLVSKQLLGALEAMLKMTDSDNGDKTYPWGINSIVFTTERMSSGKADFANFFADPMAIVISLTEIAEFVMLQVEDDFGKGKGGMSFSGLYWYCMLDSLAHDLYHSMSINCGNIGPNTTCTIEQNEDEAEKFAAEMLLTMAERFDLQHPGLGDDPWFGAQVIDYLRGHNNTEFASIYHTAEKNGVCWVDPKGEQDIAAFREWMWTKNGNGATWRQDVVKIELVENGTNLSAEDIKTEPTVMEKAEAQVAAMNIPFETAKTPEAVAEELGINPEILELQDDSEDVVINEDNADDIPEGNIAQNSPEAEIEPETVHVEGEGLQGEVGKAVETKAELNSLDGALDSIDANVEAQLKALGINEEGMKQLASMLKMSGVKPVNEAGAAVKEAQMPADINGDFDMGMLDMFSQVDDTPPAYETPEMDLPTGGTSTIEGPAPKPVAVGPGFQAQPSTPQLPTNTPAVTFDDPGLSASEYEACIMTVYKTLIDHIFAKCGFQAFPGNELWPANLDSFSNPKAILDPVSLAHIPNADKVLVSYNTVDENGRWAPNTRSVNGMVKGQVYKTSNLPAYDLVFNVGGRRVSRRLVPQNPNKKYADGNYKRTAIRARSGERLAWIMSGEKGATEFLFKYENGAVISAK